VRPLFESDPARTVPDSTRNWIAVKNNQQSVAEQKMMKTKPNHMKTITTIIYPALAIFVFAYSGFSPMVHAVSPPPDGGYPNGNTAEGQKALLSLTTGAFNTAVGFLSLQSDTGGSSIRHLALEHSSQTPATRTQPRES